MTVAIVSDHNYGPIWQHSGGAFNAALKLEQFAWLTPEQKARVERIRQASMLFAGQHREYFLNERRTQGYFPPLRRGMPPFFRQMNLLTVVAQKMADLLFGESPRFRTDDMPLQERIDGIVDRSWLTAGLHDAGVDCNVNADTMYEVTRRNGDAYIAHVPAAEMFPIGARGPDYQYASYVRYETADVAGQTEAERVTLVLETTYSAGKIARVVFRLEKTDAAGPRRGATLSLDKWPTRLADGQPLPAEELTGLSRPSIVYIPNGKRAVSDFDGLIELQDELHSKHTQIGRVIAKHSDPKLIAPPEAADEDGNLDAKAEVLFGASDKANGGYGYLTWNAELDPAQADRSFTLVAFSTAAEIPLSLLGIKDDAVAETATKMRLNAASALAKASRKAAFWRAALRLLIEIAVEVETGSPPTTSISIEMSDGLPVDEGERAETISLKRSAGTMSRRRALREEGLERAAIDDELKELDEEAKAATPSTLLDEPPARAGFGVADDNEPPLNAATE